MNIKILKADRPHTRDYPNTPLLQTHRQNPRTVNELRQTNTQTGGRSYQVHYFPRFTVDKNLLSVESPQVEGKCKKGLSMLSPNIVALKKYIFRQLVDRTKVMDI